MAGYEYLVCSDPFRRFDLRTSIEIQETDSYDDRVTKLSLLSQRATRSGWGSDLNLAVSEIVQKDTISSSSAAHIYAKFGTTSCDKIRSGTAECKMAWPYCNDRCPSELPFCMANATTYEQLQTLHYAIHRKFRNVNTVTKPVPYVPGKAFIDTSKRLEPTTSKDPWRQPGQSTWRFFLMHQNNIEATRTVVNAFQFTSRVFVPNLIIIDNSVGYEALNDAEMKAVASEIVPTPRSLNFGQLNNFMAGLALHRGLEFYFWAHSDNYVLPLSATSNFDDDFFNCLHDVIDNNQNWGMILTHYDRLSVFRVQNAIQIPFDPNVYLYGLCSSTITLLTFLKLVL
jgi:hypothetical protein